MNYQKIYQNIIKKAKAREIIGYKEIHHILPRCMGGNDESYNLVKLTAKEHFICHLLLIKIYPDEYLLKFALNMMLKSNKSQKRIVSRSYNRYKIYNSEALSKLHKGKPKSEEHKRKISESNKGKTFSIETRNKQSKWQKGKEKPWLKGRKFSEATRKKMSENNYYLGKIPNYKFTAKDREKQLEILKKNIAPAFNTKGYEILTPSGFQPFDGVAYAGLIWVLEFILVNGERVTVSTHHRFDSSNKKASEYKEGEILQTINGSIPILRIEKIGKRQTYDILNVGNGNLYYANGVQSHNCVCRVEEDDAVFPEFKKELQDKVIKEVTDPHHYDFYVSMDIGFKDLTAVLFGYYDFANAKLVIKDELVLSGTKMLTDNLAYEIKQKEKLFLNKFTGEQIKPFLRVADNNNPILLQDLVVKHDINFIPTAKDNFDAALNNCRMLLKSERIIIDPKCRVLISHLKGAIWNKQRTNFTRSPDKGHYDAAVSLIYLCRNINFNRNPFPKDGYNPNQYYSSGYKQEAATPFENYLQKAFASKLTGRKRK